MFLIRLVGYHRSPYVEASGGTGAACSKHRCQTFSAGEVSGGWPTIHVCSRSQERYNKYKSREGRGKRINTF